MIIAGKYSFNGGEEYVGEKFPGLLEEVELVISQVDKELYKTKVSKEKTMVGKKLYSPPELNRRFKECFSQQEWINYKQNCLYDEKYYTDSYTPRIKPSKNAYRDMDFVKNRLGVEVQFGKYSFMVYNVCAKMTIFKNLDIIDAGIEIVPIKELAVEMSTGVSYFEQFVWDLDNRGVSNIDVPVLILGIF